MCSTVLNKAFSHFWTSFMVWEHSRLLHACMLIVVTLALVSAFLLCWTAHSAPGAKWSHWYCKKCLFNAIWKVYISSRYSDLRNLSQAKMHLNHCVFWSPACLLQHFTCSSFPAAGSLCNTACLSASRWKRCALLCFKWLLDLQTLPDVPTLA